MCLVQYVHQHTNPQQWNLFKYNTKNTTSGVRSAELLALWQVHALGWSHSNSTYKWIWKQQSTSLHKCVSIAFGSPRDVNRIDILLREKRLSTQENSRGHVVYTVGHASLQLCYITGVEMTPADNHWLAIHTSIHSLFDCESSGIRLCSWKLLIIAMKYRTTRSLCRRASDFLNYLACRFVKSRKEIHIKFSEKWINILFTGPYLIHFWKLCCSLYTNYAKI